MFNIHNLNNIFLFLSACGVHVYVRVLGWSLKEFCMFLQSWQTLNPGFITPSVETPSAGSALVTRAAREGLRYLWAGRAEGGERGRPTRSAQVTYSATPGPAQKQNQVLSLAPQPPWLFSQVLCKNMPRYLLYFFQHHTPLLSITNYHFILSRILSPAQQLYIKFLPIPFKNCYFSIIKIISKHNRKCRILETKLSRDL